MNGPSASTEPPLPTGTITFLFTDIVASTRLWERHPQVMPGILARHDDLMQRAVNAHNGRIFKTVGDACCIVFAHSADAVLAALDAQRGLFEMNWGALDSALDGITLRVRMAIHTGEAELRNHDYIGMTLSRVSRLIGAAHGGQVLLTGAAAGAARSSLPPGVTLIDLGEHRLRDLARPEHIYQAHARGLPAQFPPLRSLGTFAHNLPLQLTSFIGREREIEAVKGLVTANPPARLLTLTGPGGTGKTRLCAQAGAELVGAFDDGVWWVELAPLADANFVGAALAQPLGVREERGIPLLSTLTGYLVTRHTLIILDNCEHLVAAAAHVAQTLLRECPRVQILATSREPLGVRGETTWSVPPLAAPGPQQAGARALDLRECEAVHLFVERARAVLPSFRLTDANAPAVGTLCRRLDGLPLAIELAAARVRALPVEQIAARLDDRFRLLTSGPRTDQPRQQTLRALFDWSYDLLSVPERVLFRRLAIMHAGWTIEAAEEVCSGHGLERDGVMELLLQLVNKSLVVGPTGERPRYSYLETIRQYALDRLHECGEADWLAERHLEHCLALAEEAEAHLVGPDQDAWFDRLEAEHDNARAALRYAVQLGDPEAALRLGGALWRFWLTRAHRFEGMAWLKQILAAWPDARPAPAVRAKALNAGGNLAYMGSEYQLAHAYYTESVALWREAGDRPGLARALHNLGNVADVLGDRELDRRLHAESAAIFREIGDRHGLATALNNQGFDAWVDGEYARARELHEEAMELYHALGDELGRAVALVRLARVALAEKDCARARELCLESQVLFRKAGDQRNVAGTLQDLGLIALCAADYPQAQRDYLACLRACREIGEQEGTAMALEGLAAVAGAIGQPRRAARLFGAADALRDAINIRRLPPYRAEYDRVLEVARVQLDPQSFAAAWAEGRALSAEQAVAEGMDAQ